MVPRHEKKQVSMKSILEFGMIYDWYQNLVGVDGYRRLLVGSYIRPFPGQRVLDIGCGTAELLDYLPEVDYVGLDHNPDYIRRAQQRFGQRGRFHLGGISADDPHLRQGVDVALALGVLHHLDDATASDLLTLAHDRLRPGGRLITVDPCVIPGQSRWARFMVLNDRGRHVRDHQGYLALMRKHFPDASHDIRHDVLRIPFTELFMVGERASE
ncbi:MAG: class I SAM-dependent methyltransferase [Magnetococcus sp. WYHC-3]